MNLFENRIENNAGNNLENNAGNNTCYNMDFPDKPENRYNLKEFFRIIAEENAVPEKVDERMREIILRFTGEKPPP